MTARHGADDETLVRFIGLTFRSVWAVELLTLLHARPREKWTRDQLIQSLRASEQVLLRSIEDLAGADLIRTEHYLLHYRCEQPVMKETVAAVIELYKSRPSIVRRIIAGGGNDDQLARFAAAFRLRGEGK